MSVSFVGCFKVGVTREMREVVSCFAVTSFLCTGDTDKSPKKQVNSRHQTRRGSLKRYLRFVACPEAEPETRPGEQAVAWLMRGRVMIR